MDNILKETIDCADEKDIKLRTKGVFRPDTKQIGNSLVDISNFYKKRSEDGVVVVPLNIPPPLNRVKKSLLRHLQPGSFLYEKNFVTGNEASKLEENAERLLILMESLALAMAIEVKNKPSKVICDVLLAVCNQPVFVLTLVDGDPDDVELRMYNISVARGVTRKLKLFMDEHVCVVYGVCKIKDIEDTDTIQKTLKEHARLSSIFIPQKTFESCLPKFNSIVSAIWASVAETNSVKINHKDGEVKRFLTKDQCVLLLENINNREVTVQHAPRSGATILMLEVARRLSLLNDILCVCSSQEQIERLRSIYPNTRIIDHQMREQHRLWRFEHTDTNGSVLEEGQTLISAVPYTSGVSEPEDEVVSEPEDEVVSEPEDEVVSEPEDEDMFLFNMMEGGGEEEETPRKRFKNDSALEGESERNIYNVTGLAPGGSAGTVNAAGVVHGGMGNTNITMTGPDPLHDILGTHFLLREQRHISN